MMQLSTINWIKKTIEFCVIIGGVTLVSGCNRTEQPPAQTYLPSETSLSTPTSTPILATQTETPTLTPTLIPTAAAEDPLIKTGLIILAMGDGAHRHLFAYHPSYLPLTRLTTGDWDYNSPAISPDGTRLAFCSTENGRWDIYLLDLTLNLTFQLTDSQTYNCAPSWSPDGEWLAYETYHDDRFDIVIQSVTDPGAPLIWLTENAGNNTSPAWSPGGREIAFTTDRSGHSEIWLARLDTTQDRFAVLMSDRDADFSSPAWSPDANAIAWCRKDTESVLQVWYLDQEKSDVTTLGYGKYPAWVADGSGVLGILELPGGNDLIAYNALTANLLLPPIPMPQRVSSLDWKAGPLYENLQRQLQTSLQETSKPLWEPKLTVNTSTGRYGLVKLTGVTAPEPYLSDKVNESFESMRKSLARELGWDFLVELENAAISLTSAAQPGISENWLYTGRAITVNLDPLDAGWMVVTREDYTGQIYWRVWLKCLRQDGSCGAPMRAHVWNFNAALTGDRDAYENGGAVTSVPAGYWLDFTEFASWYGWERLQASLNWRGYFPASHLNLFVHKGSLLWEEALLELYPPEALTTILAQ